MSMSPVLQDNRSVARDLGTDLAFALFGSVLLWLSAKVQIPFWPVPMTMQTLVVVLLPMLFGARAGVGAVIVYLTEGAAGLPVFAETPAQGIGLGYMMGPTGGYLFGFVLAASVIAAVKPMFKSGFISGAVLATIGHAVIFACGLSWLCVEMPMDKAIAVGFMPFIAASLIKIGIAACTYKLTAK